MFAPQQAGRGAGASFQQQQSEGEETQKSYPTGEKHFQQSDERLRSSALTCTRRLTRGAGPGPFASAAGELCG